MSEESRDDEAAREERARELYEHIEDLTGDAPPPPRSPHEHVERAMDDERSGQPEPEPDDPDGP